MQISFVTKMIALVSILVVSNNTSIFSYCYSNNIVMVTIIIDDFVVMLTSPFPVMTSVVMVMVTMETPKLLTVVV